MKQIIQDLKSGTTSLEDVPVPLVKKDHILIRTHRSLVSLGTEKMLVEFGKANFIDKVRKQPEKVILITQEEVYTCLYCRLTNYLLIECLGCNLPIHLVGWMNTLWIFGTII